MILEILLYPDERLREVCLPVVEFDENLKTLLKNLEDTMYASGGIGISAPQIGVSQQVFILDAHFFGAPKKLIYINPTIIHRSLETSTEEEGCLSFPGVFLRVERPLGIILSYQDETGLHHQELIEGYKARAAVHEHDHVMGRVFLDYVGRLKKSLVEKKLSKRKKK